MGLSQMLQGRWEISPVTKASTTQTGNPEEPQEAAPAVLPDVAWGGQAPGGP